MLVSWLYPAGLRKAVTLSYDDGQIHDRRLVDIFNRHGLRGTFFLNSSCVGHSQGHLTREELPSLLANHELAIHTVNHPLLPMLPDEMVIKQVMDDRRVWESVMKKPILGFGYPCGDFDDRVVGLLKAMGIKYGRTVINDPTFNPPRDPLRWAPTCHHKHDLLNTTRRFLDQHAYNPMLLYVWGHSFEFEGDGNWNLIEDFGKLIGHNPAIWYATNIEIIDYMEAIARVRCSVDGEFMTNPNACSIWFNIDGTAIEIRPGETRRVQG